MRIADPSARNKDAKIKKKAAKFSCVSELRMFWVKQNKLETISHWNKICDVFEAIRQKSIFFVFSRRSIALIFRQLWSTVERALTLKTYRGKSVKTVYSKLCYCPVFELCSKYNVLKVFHDFSHTKHFWR